MNKKIHDKSRFLYLFCILLLALLVFFLVCRNISLQKGTGKKSGNLSDVGNTVSPEAGTQKDFEENDAAKIKVYFPDSEMPVEITRLTANYQTLEGTAWYDKEIPQIREDGNGNYSMLNRVLWEQFAPKNMAGTIKDISSLDGKAYIQEKLKCTRNDKVISFCREIWYSAGGLNAIKEGKTFLVSDGSVIEIEDVIAGENEDERRISVERLHELIIKAVEKNEDVKERGGSCDGEYIENYKNKSRFPYFCFTESGMLFFFEQGEFNLPMAFGCLEAEVPYEELMGCIKEIYLPTEDR